MSTFHRWGKFNLVGAMGMAVQMSSLAIFHLWMPEHYLCASAAALELTLCHNFLWHWHYTWSDRRDGTSGAYAFVRFQLSNGLVSLLGNLVLMWFFVREVHMPVLIANAVAVLCCSVVNFFLGNIWAFGGRRTVVVPAALALLLMAPAVRAQVPSLPSAPEPQKKVDYGQDCAYLNVFAGPVATVGGVAVRPTGMAGVTFGMYRAYVFPHGFGAAPQFELGVIGPLPGGYPLDGFASFNEVFATKVQYRDIYPFFTGGYTRMFATGNAANFGLGVDVGRDKSGKAVRLEVRDYYLFTGPQQHVLALRIGWGQLVGD